MSIRSGTAVTATDLNSLKTKILTMYGNRTINFGLSTPLSDSSNQYNSAVTNSTFARGGKIKGSPGLGALINACLVINDIPNLRWVSSTTSSYIQPTGGKIFGDGSTTELLAGWLTNAKRDASGTSTSHGCRGACVGICSGGCANVSKGTTGGTYSNTCTDCSSGCYSNCSSTCLGGYTSECDCVACCQEQCSGSCSTKCGASCTGTCGGACGTGCYYGCSGACQETCKNGCAINCTGGCYGSAKSNAYT